MKLMNETRIKLIAETYIEEQFLLDKFPDSWWEFEKDNTIFYISMERKKEVLDALKEWKEIKEKYGKQKE